MGKRGNGETGAGMLPNLARLDLRHEAEVTTGSPEALDMMAHEPPLTLATPREADEADDESRRKWGVAPYQQEGVEKRFPLDTASALEGGWLNVMFTEVLVWDEPPNRHLFSALGPPNPIRHVRLSKHSNLVMGMTLLSTNAFAALRALRKRFANRPTSHNSRQGCGSSNCHETGVELFGNEDWQLALRAIMVALDQGENQWQGGATLPITVTIRAPKQSRTRFDFFSHTFTMDNREELGLTLRAAHLGISPPVFATFPVQISSAQSVLAERGYGYVFEDGWVDLHRLIKRLQFEHTISDDLGQAQRNIETSVTLLLRKVAHNDIVLMDIKLHNMVGRRVGDTLEYEVRMIDFGSNFTAIANMHKAQKSTSAQCIFFVNGLLLLNYIFTYGDWMVPIFCGLAREVAETWRGMANEGDGFCAELREDHNRVEAANAPSMRSLIREPEDTFPALLRFAFYRMLDTYGKEGKLLKLAKTEGSKPGFIDRFVDVLEREFTKTPGC